MFRDLVCLGDKVDICIVQQLRQNKKTSGFPHVYKCQVSDITDDDELEITMPIEVERLVLLPLGVRYEFTFYTTTGFYHSIGQIKERYKKDNIYVMSVELHSQLKKFQRREYYRCPCLINAQLYFVSKEDAITKTTDWIFEELRDENFYKKQKRVAVHDLSGGGARIVGDEKIKVDSYILLIINLCSENVDKQYFLTGHVLDSEKIEKSDGKFESRIQFMIENDQIREEIIRYIFEEERKVRQVD